MALGPYLHLTTLQVVEQPQSAIIFPVLPSLPGSVNWALTLALFSLSSQFGLEATRKRQSALSVAAVYTRIDPQSFQPAISGSLDGCTLIATLESFSPTTGLCVVRADRPYRRSAGRPCAVFHR